MSAANDKDLVRAYYKHFMNIPYKFEKGKQEIWEKRLVVFMLEIEKRKIGMTVLAKLYSMAKNYRENEDDDD
jgi:hypothetical protein